MNGGDAIPPGKFVTFMGTALAICFVGVVIVACAYLAGSASHVLAWFFIQGWDVIS